jgi:flagellar hook assembly protein FlgD
MKIIPATLTSLCTLLLTLPSLSADTLKADAAAAGLDWIIGTWGDKATNGAAVRLSYEWRLDGHVVGVKLTAPDRNAEGMIARNAKTQEIGYVSVDNQGGGAIGKVVPDSGNIVIKVAYTDGGSEQGKMAVTHEQRGADTMKLIVSQLSDSGEVLDTKMEIELVKIKETAAAPK